MFMSAIVVLKTFTVNRYVTKTPQHAKLPVMNRLSAMVLTMLASMSAITCGGEPKSGPPGAIGTPAPLYGAVTMDGDSVDLASLRQHVVLLNVWATWCIPCRREIPELQALHQDLESRGLKVLGVSVDGGDAQGDVAGFVSDFGMTYTVLRDPGERVLTIFRIQGVPASYLIDREGVVRWKTLGPFKASDSGLQAALRETLTATN
jgi:cytochrome c biogenesis protein CcmG/thiol:disulfide interchange protein DsbE